MSDVESFWRTHKGKDGSPPAMVFSIIGDSKKYVPRHWPKTVFQTALIEAAKTGGKSWILYRGHDTGVSDIIREASRNYKDLESRKHHFNSKYEGRTDTKETDIKDEQTKKKDIKEEQTKKKDINEQKKKEESKEVNQRVKFISIADNKKICDESLPECNKAARAGDDFLLEFEKFVSEQDVHFLSQNLDVKMRIPIAIIVCEGDIETIKHISSALENKLPVIIIKGSGKAADLILNYLDNSDMFRKKAILCGLRFDDDTCTYAELMDTLKKIKENEDMIDVFDVNNDDPLTLSKITGEAVINCWEKHQAEQISDENRLKNKTSVLASTTSSLTQKLGKLEPKNLVEEILNHLSVDYMESRLHVLNPKYASPTLLPLSFYFIYQHLQESGLLTDVGGILLFKTMEANRCDYVRVLLDQRISLDNLPLQRLYEKASLTLLSEELRKDYPSDSTTAILYCCKILGYIGKKQRDIIAFKEQIKNRGNTSISDLLLWAIFANRREIAEICWRQGKDHLLTGLVCSAVLRMLAEKVKGAKEDFLSSKFEEHSKIFEQRCITIMDRMYEEDPQHAIYLMDDETVVWGITSSPLAFAYENFMYDIVAHTCSQKNMDGRWYNNLTPNVVSYIKSGLLHYRKRLIAAPRTKYVCNYLMFCCVLVTYSAFVLTSISTEYYIQGIARGFEYFMYFWAAGDLIEESISCFGSKSRVNRGYYARIKRYLRDFWNKVDLLSHVLLITALCVRHAYPSDTFTIARRMFSLSLLVMYLRFLEIFLINRQLGPTVLMIKEMLKDLFRFLLVAFYIVIGVGIYYHANLWPDHQGMWNGGWTKWRIWKILYYPYFQLYGELFNDFFEGNDLSDCSNITSVWQSDPSIERCPQEDWTVLAISALYMLFSNLLLVNLVIAMFSSTYERIQENADKLWKFEMCTVIYDYEQRIPSPINLIFRPARFLFSRCANFCCKNKINPAPKEDRKPEQDSSTQNT